MIRWLELCFSIPILDCQMNASFQQILIYPIDINHCEICSIPAFSFVCLFVLPYQCVFRVFSSMFRALKFSMHLGIVDDTSTVCHNNVQRVYSNTQHMPHAGKAIHSNQGVQSHRSANHNCVIDFRLFSISLTTPNRFPANISNHQRTIIHKIWTDEYITQTANFSLCTVNNTCGEK